MEPTRVRNRGQVSVVVSLYDFRLVGRVAGMYNASSKDTEIVELSYYLIGFGLPRTYVE